MALTITAVDNANGSGITATVAGSDLAQTVSVYASSVNQGGSSPTWALAGSRSSNGTLLLALGAGHWYLYAAGTVSAAPAVSAPIIGVASQSASAVYTLVKAAVQARIQSLTLTGLTTPPGDLPAERVYIFPELTQEIFPLITLPAVLITPPPQGRETIPGVLNNKDDIGHPVLVSIVDRASPQNKALPATYDRWREQIFRALRFQRLTGAPTIMTVLPEPGPIAEWRRPEYQIFWSTITFRAISREPRGA